ncbi:MAG TPA: response regulator [Turneriella sp.]|nr:response regulator [Turneriella sp.]
MSNREPILIVEDDLVQQELIETILNEMPYALTFVDNTKDALDAFDKMQYPVVLCDIYLKGGDSGVEVLKQLFEREIPPVVVMQTIEGGTRQVIECLRLGAYDYIVKPIVPNELRKTIERAFDEVHKCMRLRTLEKERARQLETQQATQRVAAKR